MAANPKTIPPAKPVPAKTPKTPPTQAEMRAEYKENAENILRTLERIARKTTRLMKRAGGSEAQTKAFTAAYNSRIEALEAALAGSVTVKSEIPSE